jgi:hypothetical protein
MCSDSNNSREVEVRDRITHFMQADGDARSEEVAHEDVQTLRAAAARLNKMLKDIEEVRRKEAREKDVQTLQTATSHLERLLAGMSGKEVMPEVKLRPKKDTTK